MARHFLLLPWMMRLVCKKVCTENLCSNWLANNKARERTDIIYSYPMSSPTHWVFLYMIPLQAHKSHFRTLPSNNPSSDLYPLPHLWVILPILVTLGAVARVQDHIGASVVHASLVSSDLSLLAQHPELEKSGSISYIHFDWRVDLPQPNAKLKFYPSVHGTNYSTLNIRQGFTLLICRVSKCPSTHFYSNLSMSEISWSVEGWTIKVTDYNYLLMYGWVPI